MQFLVCMNDEHAFSYDREQNELYIGVRRALTQQKWSTDMAYKKRSTELTCVDMQRDINQ